MSVNCFPVSIRCLSFIVNLQAGITVDVLSLSSSDNIVISLLGSIIVLVQLYIRDTVSLFIVNSLTVYKLEGD